ncbi:amino acid transporter, partial [Rhizoctonia solani]
MAPLGRVVDPGLESSATIGTFPRTRAEPSLPKAQYSYGSRDILNASITENAARSRISSRMVVGYDPGRFLLIRTELMAIAAGALIIGLLAPSSDPSLDLTTSDAAASPFVVAIQITGIKGLPPVIDAALLTSARSIASTNLFTSSPAFCSLSLAVNAPKVFSKASRSGLYASVIICASLSSLTHMSASSGKGKALNWFANMTAVAGLMTWFGIPVTCMRFYAGMKAQGIDRCAPHFSSGLQPFVARLSVLRLGLLIATIDFAHGLVLITVHSVQVTVGSLRYGAFAHPRTFTNL